MMSRNNSSRLPVESVNCRESPVALPPGRARLWTRPLPTGSAAAAITIGIVDVAFSTARTWASPLTTMTSTPCWTYSAAISPARGTLPSAQRYSIAMVRPSTQPSSARRCFNAARLVVSAAGVLGPMKPMVGNFAEGWAAAASGQAAATPPSVSMNSRRLMDAFPRARTGRYARPTVSQSASLCTCVGDRSRQDRRNCRRSGKAPPARPGLPCV